MCSKHRTSRCFTSGRFYYFYSPPIKVDPAQKFREWYVLSIPAVKREVSGVGTLRFNQKGGDVISFFQATEDFFNQFDVICGTGYCEFMLKKLDKKRER